MFPTAKPLTVDSVLDAAYADILETNRRQYADWIVSTLPPSWLVYRHIQFIGALIDGLISGKYRNLMLNLPPQHAKTETVTVRFPLFAFEHRPDANVLITGYNQDFAERLSRFSNELAVRLRKAKAKQAASEWRTHGGGTVVARGVGAPPTGIGFEFMLMDDPIKSMAEAMSPLVREQTWNWYQSDLLQRKRPDTAMVYIGTRWHPDDIAARLIDTEGLIEEGGAWKKVNLPSIAEAKDPMGRAVGEALWPEKRPLDFLIRQAAGYGGVDSHLFNAIYQGRPAPRDGVFFSPEMIRTVRYQDIPGQLRRVRAWDLAATADGGDYTVGVRMAGPDAQGRFYVEDVVRGRWNITERNRRILATARSDGQEVLILGPEDPSSAGKEAVISFRSNLRGFRVKMIKVSRGSLRTKITNAEMLANLVGAGLVLIVDAPWNAPFLTEHKYFPNGTYDDIVDATADAINFLFRPTSLPENSSPAFINFDESANARLGLNVR